MADQIRTFSYHGEEIPSWREVKTMLMQKGRVIAHK
jgi:hypothetical protein